MYSVLGFMFYYNTFFLNLPPWGISGTFQSQLISLKVRFFFEYEDLLCKNTSVFPRSTGNFFNWKNTYYFGVKEHYVFSNLICSFQINNETKFYLDTFILFTYFSTAKKTLNFLIHAEYFFEHFYIYRISNRKFVIYYLQLI